MTTQKLSLLLIGCGKMGGALLERWHADYQCTVIEPRGVHVHGSIKIYPQLEALPAGYAPDVIIFAVKPQQLEDILPAFRIRFAQAPLYLSIAAGKNLAFYARHLGAHAHIVRAMPNTPAMVGHGMTVLCAAPTLPAARGAIATRLMESVGKTEWLDEELMDAVTAMSGSGPAYVFLFLGALTQAGVQAGLPETVARTLALQTLSGSCALAAKYPHESFEQLRKNVTSPGGTTEAALHVLMNGGTFEKLVREAVGAAAHRSKELSQ